MFEHLLFGTKSIPPHTFPEKTRIYAGRMHTIAMSHPAPIGIVNLATTNWKRSASRLNGSPFYGHS